MAYRIRLRSVALSRRGSRSRPSRRHLPSRPNLESACRRPGGQLQGIVRTGSAGNRRGYVPVLRAWRAYPSCADSACPNHPEPELSFCASVTRDDVGPALLGRVRRHPSGKGRLGLGETALASRPCRLRRLFLLARKRQLWVLTRYRCAGSRPGWAGRDERARDWR